MLAAWLIAQSPWRDQPTAGAAAADAALFANLIASVPVQPLPRRERAHTRFLSCYATPPTQGTAQDLGWI